MPPNVTLLLLLLSLGIMLRRWRSLTNLLELLLRLLPRCQLSKQGLEVGFFHLGLRPCSLAQQLDRCLKLAHLAVHGGLADPAAHPQLVCRRAGQGSRQAGQGCEQAGGAGV